jgi:hypothetical protein
MADFNSYIQSLMQNPNPQGGMMGTGRSSQLVTPEQLLQGRGADTYSYVADPFRAQNFIDSGQFATQQDAQQDAYRAGRENPAVFGMSAERQAAAAAAQQAAMQGNNGMLTQVPTNTAQAAPQGRLQDVNQEQVFRDATQFAMSGQGTREDYIRNSGAANNFSEADINTVLGNLPQYQLSDVNQEQVFQDASQYASSGQGSRADYIQKTGNANNFSQADINTVLGNLPQYQMADVNLAQVYKDADAYAAAGRGTAADYVQLAGNTNNFSQFDIDNVLGGLKARGMFSNLS